MEVTNRFNGLDLVAKVPEELWMEFPNTVQDAVTKTIPQKKKSKKAKWLSVEALQIAEKRRKVKGKGERERLKIFSRKLEKPREYFMQRWVQ